MTGTATPIFPQTVKNYVQQIQNSDGTTIKTLAAGGANGSKIEVINITSTDTSARDIALYMLVSAVSYLLTTISIPITAGSVNNVISVDILRNAQFPALTFDNNGNKYIYVANGSTLQIAALTTVTSTKAIQIFAQGGDF
jgi:hypothetical protein